jgi:N-acetylglutamate synthase-like GNAT family acetyltransferase
MACEPATRDDLPAIISLLAACGLPTEDVREAPGTVHLVWREDGLLVGTVGVDVAGELAWLRSLAVAPAQRGRGLGSALTAAAEQRAVASGARTLLLLTESADALARACGFAEVSRCALDPGANAFRQFSAGCCAGATCYLKRVGPAVEAPA